MQVINYSSKQFFKRELGYLCDFTGLHYRDLTPANNTRIKFLPPELSDKFGVFDIDNSTQLIKCFCTALNSLSNRDQRIITICYLDPRATNSEAMRLFGRSGGNYYRIKKLALGAFAAAFYQSQVKAGLTAAIKLN